MLKFVRDNYGNPPMIITENGVSERNGTLEDDSRITFYRDYINNVLKGITILAKDTHAYEANFRAFGILFYTIPSHDHEWMMWEALDHVVIT